MRKRLAAPLLAMGAFLAFAPSASAHGFGQRFDLPVPLGLFIAGAAAAVLLSFVAMGLFVRRGERHANYPRTNLLRRAPVRALGRPVVVGLLEAVSVGAFALTVLAGFLGVQSPIRNLVPTMVWIIWWVGLAYVCALVGNVWELLNPWRITFAWGERLRRRFGPGGPPPEPHPYPARLGVWPAAALFLWFAWGEIVWPDRDLPHSLALAAVLYSVITWTGMAVFGAERWLRHGEAFSVVFRLLAGFAPTEVRVTSPSVCAECAAGECRSREGGCVNCYACFRRAEAAERELNLRPPAVGLLTETGDGAHPSMVALVLLVLATVTFDGFTDTAFYQGIRVLVFNSLDFGGRYALLFTDTLMLLSFPALFLAVFLFFCAMMRLSSGGALSTGQMARLFVFSLVPIAVGYHLAHYFSFLFIQGQRIIPLASDPFGFGWDLFGTAAHRIDIGIVGVKTVWYVSLAAIVGGHILAVYLAHVVALRAMKNGFAALRSQYPMLVLMVGYTMVSLWIIAQPIVEGS